MTNRRLYLFDIDGTLITTGGAGGKAMKAAFMALWANQGAFVNIEFSGRTDYAIFKQALIQAGLYGESFPSDFARFRRAYYRRLPASLVANQGVVLPGVVEILERLSNEKNATLAVGTGNFKTGAIQKLRHYGLHRYFRAGGYGDSTEDRSELIAQGIRAADRAAGRHDSVVVIGDTVHDITAAKANGAIAIAVSTGTVSADALAEAGADVVLPNLVDAYERLTC